MKKYREEIAKEDRDTEERIEKAIEKEKSCFVDFVEVTLEKIQDHRRQRRRSEEMKKYSKKREMEITKEENSERSYCRES